MLFQAIDSDHNFTKTLDSCCPVKARLELKVGAQVSLQYIGIYHFTFTADNILSYISTLQNMSPCRNSILFFRICYIVTLLCQIESYPLPSAGIKLIGFWLIGRENSRSQPSICMLSQYNMFVYRFNQTIINYQNIHLTIEYFTIPGAVNEKFGCRPRLSKWCSWCG